ncbi:MAG: outer membrane lipoprotein-sorting protein [Gammaproteobacteria bacterium]|nr:outer membrane lipoprotein-sorting protein [Gammaproteobacteria bacterium]
MGKYFTMLIGAVALFAAFSAQAITADELIAKNAAARGGSDKIKAIKTLKFDGKMHIIGGFGSIDLDVVMYQKAPDKVRMEATVQGMTSVQAWDGSEAWQIAPFRGRVAPERMSADDAKALADGAPISGQLIGYKARGSKVEYLGTEDVEGTQAHKLKVTLKNGDVLYVYLDPDYFLEIRTVSQTEVRGTQVEVVTDYGDFRKVAGVYFPFLVTAHAEGGDGGTQKITIEKAEANIPIPDSLFEFPTETGAKAKAAK